MRFFLIFALGFLLTLPALAQEETAQESVDTDKRVELATEMHRVWPISSRVEEAVNLVAESVPDAERDAFRTRMRKAIDQRELEQESIKAMAQVYSEAELRAMVDFYGSAEGRSVSAKTEDYMALLQPVMVKMLDSALLKLRTGEPLQSSPAQGQ